MGPIGYSINSIDANPFNKVSSFFTSALRNFDFRFYQCLFFPSARLCGRCASFLQFNGLIMPPIITIQVTFVPVFRPFRCLVVSVFILVMDVLEINMNGYGVVRSICIDREFPIYAITTTMIRINRATFNNVMFIWGLIGGQVLYGIFPCFLRWDFGFVVIKKVWIISMILTDLYHA